MRPMLWLFGLLVGLGALGCAVTPINIPLEDTQVKVPGDLAGAGMDAPGNRLEAGAPPLPDVPSPSFGDKGMARDAGGEGGLDLRPGETRPADAGPAKDALNPVEAGKPKKDVKP